MRRKKTRFLTRAGKSAIAGALGGLAGALTMSLSARLWDKLVGGPGLSKSELGRLEARRFVSGSAQELDSISKAADWVDARIFRHRLSPTQKAVVAALAHYAVGASVGAAYGVLAEAEPIVTRAMGVPFGVAESVGVESIGLSLAGVTLPLRDYRMRDYIQSAVDHAVYSTTVEMTRRLARGAA